MHDVVANLQHARVLIKLRNTHLKARGRWQGRWQSLPGNVVGIRNDNKLQVALETADAMYR